MSRPKIPADSFVVVNGASGFALIVLQSEFDLAQADKGPSTSALGAIEEIRMSPIVAKQLARNLAGSVRQYEDAFGEIREIPSFAGKSN